MINVNIIIPIAKIRKIFQTTKFFAKNDTKYTDPTIFFLEANEKDQNMFCIPD